MPTQEISSCLIIPTFSNQVCIPTNWWDELAMEMLPDTYMPLVWPILSLLGTSSFHWPQLTHFFSLPSQVLQNPEDFGRLGISLGRESHPHWSDTFLSLISCLDMCSLTFTIKEKHGDKITLTSPKIKTGSLMCQPSEGFSLASGLPPISVAAHCVVVFSMAFLCGKVGKGSGNLGWSPC